MPIAKNGERIRHLNAKRARLSEANMIVGLGRRAFADEKGHGNEGTIADALFLRIPYGEL